MSLLKNAFKKANAYTAKDMIIERPGGTSYSMKASVSNYQRNMQGPEEIVFSGREFIVDRDDVKDWPDFPIQRGDYIVDSGEYGENSVTEIIILHGLKGEVLGYRLRVE